VAGLLLFLLLEFLVPGGVFKHLLGVFASLLLNLFVLLLRQFFDLFFELLLHLLLIVAEVAVLLLVLGAQLVDLILQFRDFILLIVGSHLFTDSGLGWVFDLREVILKLLFRVLILVHLRFLCQDLLAEIEDLDFAFTQITASGVLVLDIHYEERPVLACREQVFVVVADLHSGDILTMRLHFVDFLEREFPNLH